MAPVLRFSVAIPEGFDNTIVDQSKTNHELERQ